MKHTAKFQRNLLLPSPPAGALQLVRRRALRRRPRCLGEPPGPQERVQRHTVEQHADFAAMVQILDVPVAQIVDQLVDVLKLSDAAIPSKLSQFPRSRRTPSRSVRFSVSHSLRNSWWQCQYGRGGCRASAACLSSRPLTLQFLVRYSMVAMETNGAGFPGPLRCIPGGLAPLTPQMGRPGVAHRQPRAEDTYWARMTWCTLPVIMQLQQSFFGTVEMPQIQFLNRLRTFQLCHRDRYAQCKLCRKPVIPQVQFLVVDVPDIMQDKFQQFSELRVCKRCRRP